MLVTFASSSPFIANSSNIFRNTIKVTFCEGFSKNILFSVRLGKYPNHLLEIEAQEIVDKKIKVTMPKKLRFNNRIAV